MANISIDDVVKHETLPIDSQDIVTKVKLVVAGSPAGAQPAMHWARTYPIGDTLASEQVTYSAVPIVYEYEDTLHATYGAERSFSLPEGINPFLEPADAGVPEPDLASGVTNAGSPSAIRDGDGLTYAEGALGSIALIRYTSTDPLFCGFRLKYSLDITRASPLMFPEVGAPARISVTLSSEATDGVGDTVVMAAAWPARENGTDQAEVYAVTLFDARGELVNAGEAHTKTSVIAFSALNQTDGGTLKVFEFYPLILDETVLLDIAKANIKLPAVTPKRVTVDGVVDPLATSHTIVGWPGGDYTADVARQTYRDGVTIIDFEQAGAPTGVPQEAVEAERVRVARTRATIATAGYGLKMGERQ